MTKRIWLRARPRSGGRERGGGAGLSGEAGHPRRCRRRPAGAPTLRPPARGGSSSRSSSRSSWSRTSRAAAARSGSTLITAAQPDGHTLGFIWNSPLTASPHSLRLLHAGQLRAGDVDRLLVLRAVRPAGLPGRHAQEMIAELKAALRASSPMAMTASAAPCSSPPSAYSTSSR